MTVITALTGKTAKTGMTGMTGSDQRAEDRTAQRGQA